jgi:muconolactone delta-isomerase
MHPCKSVAKLSSSVFPCDARYLAASYIQESKMQYLVLVSRSESASSMALLKQDIEAEAEFVRHLYADGVVRQIWLRAEGGACMLAEADNLGHLQQLLASLPLVKSGYLAQPQISQLRAYSGFAPRSS